MPLTLKPFEYEVDFLSVRDFLSRTYQVYQRPLNWRIERWEYAFHFIAPYFGNWDQDPPSEILARETFQMLEGLTGCWKNGDGEIIGVVNIEHPHHEHPDFGEFFIHRHPQHLDLLPEMITYAESHLFHPETGKLFIYVDNEDRVLQKLLEKGGFTPDPQDQAIETLLDLGKCEIPGQVNLPDGFKIQSMADDNDLARRCKAFGCAFNHPDPIDWPPVLAYRSLQGSPDYRKEQDIVVVSPEGEFAAFCLIWYDQRNRLASLEPVGTQPGFRRMGLAREAVFEAIRRVKTLGAKWVAVGSDQDFYLKMGFEPNITRTRFEKTL